MVSMVALLLGCNVYHQDMKNAILPDKVSFGVTIQNEGSKYEIHSYNIQFQWDLK